MARDQRQLVNPVRDLFDATAHHYAIKLTCRGCRRQRVFAAAALWWHFTRRSIPDWLREIPKKCRCRTCGKRGPHLDLVQEEPNDHSLPLPSEHEWKRELRRRR